MSVRAYRVTKMEREESDTFNLWHDNKLMEFLNSEYGFYERLANDGSGLVELSIETLQEALKKVEMDDELREAIRRDIEACQNEGYVTYYCY